MPDLEVRTLDGQQVPLRSLAGKVVLVDFWATWCRPCIRELPNLKALYGKHAGEGFEIVGLSLDDSREKTLQFLADNQVEWQVSHLDDGWQSEVVKAYGVNALPSLWLYDRSGRLRYYNIKGDELGRAVEELL